MNNEKLKELKETAKKKDTSYLELYSKEKVVINFKNNSSFKDKGLSKDYTPNDYTSKDYKSKSKNYNPGFFVLS